MAFPCLKPVEPARELDHMLEGEAGRRVSQGALARGRLLILCMLAEGEKSVTEIERALDLRQPTVSQQLARLRADGLVATRRDGKAIYYSLASEEARVILGAVRCVLRQETEGVRGTRPIAHYGCICLCNLIFILAVRQNELVYGFLCGFMALRK